MPDAPRPMKVLFVAMPDSVHTARWIRQLSGDGWEVRLFPSQSHGVVHPQLSHIPVYHTLGGSCRGVRLKLRLQRHPWFARWRAFLGRVLRRLRPQGRTRQLLRVIAEFQPDVVHSLEFQAAGYLTLSARRLLGGHFPPWIATNWGSDIYHFRHFPEHEGKIREVLELCDYYSCECRRDVCLAQGMGLRGKVLPVLPNAGGFELEALQALRQPGPASGRRVIVLKGYDHWVGRALVGLAALEQCAELLQGYQVAIHSASPETRAAAALFQNRTGVPVELVPKGTPHQSILALYGRARIAIGLSTSDGVSTSFLEGLVMGAFPIQSWTACADEWIEQGRSGLLVPPEDAAAVAAALMRALSEDDLVDQAARLNAVTAHQRLERREIAELARGYYRTVAHDRGIHAGYA